MIQGLLFLCWAFFTNPIGTTMVFAVGILNVLLYFLFLCGFPIPAVPYSSPIFAFILAVLTAVNLYLPLATLVQVLFLLVMLKGAILLIKVVLWIFSWVIQAVKMLFALGAI